MARGIAANINIISFLRNAGHNKLLTYFTTVVFDHTPSVPLVSTVVTSLTTFGDFLLDFLEVETFLTVVLGTEVFFLVILLSLL